MPPNPIVKCSAPSCDRDAELLADGTDYDGTEFYDEPVCEPCASYLAETEGTTLRPVVAANIARGNHAA